MNDVKTCEWDVKKSVDVLRGVLADGNDGVLPPGEPARDHASVKHAAGAVFFWNAKGGEIVNGGDERAGAGPEHPAITGHVQHIEAEIASELRQGALVPEDVFDGRAKCFGHRHKLHFSLGEREER